MDTFFSTSSSSTAWGWDGGEDEYEHPLLRLLAPKKEVKMGYSVLSVAVLTLGLIMFMELFRHRLDHSAEGRPFMKSVLEGVYAELAILGFVELAVFIMQTYYPNYDKGKKAVFGDVHFCLFYTAIFNALQALLLAWVSFRAADKMWVHTENLELNHYVEIREEFTRVQDQLAVLKNKSKSKDQGSLSSTDSDEEQLSAPRPPPKNLTASGITQKAEDAVDLSAGGFNRTANSVMDRIRYPHLKALRDQLLVQIRFHELRLSFVKAYKLPLKFKVSDYLIKSQLDTMLHLVHISTLAWLVLTASISLLYFVMGIVAYQTEDSAAVVGKSLSWIFFWCMASFNVIAFLVYNKMKLVFRSIMQLPILWNIEDENAEKKKLTRQQLALFWGSDPHMVTAVIQSMQFGYSVALSVLIVFWKVIDNGNVPVGYYFLMFFVCYALFVVVVGQVIPRYTLCTSLGQLVNQHHLSEMKASYLLEEAKRKEKRRRMNLSSKREMHIDSTLASFALPNSDLYDEDEGPEPSMLPKQLQVSSVDTSAVIKKAGSFTSLASLERESDAGSTDPEEEDADQAQKLAELVLMNTSDLRTSLPQAEREKLSLREQGGQKLRTSSRLKSLSDGVNAMTKPSNKDSGSVASKSRSNSAGVGAMAAMDDDDDDNHSIADSSYGGGYLYNPGEEGVMHVSMRDRIRNYYRSTRYVVLSNVFGTMVAFYFVGQRVEEFLLTEGLKSPSFVSFAWDNTVTFWLLASWLLMFLMSAVFIIVLFRRYRHDMGHYRERRMIVSAMIDFIITGVCLTVFFVAESQRCCYPEEDQARYLADEKDYDNGYDKAATSDYGYGADDKGYGAASAYGYLQPAPCSCPRFGSRLYGGLGTIEPYVSLIALRVFRHWLSRRIVRFLDSRKKASHLEPSLSIHPINFDPFNFPDDGEDDDENEHDDGHGHGHDDHHGGHGEGASLVQLWGTAIHENPEIVAKYGEFSGELLKAMLGVPVVIPEESDETQTGQVPKSAATEDKIAAGALVPAQEPSAPRQPETSGVEWIDTFFASRSQVREDTAMFVAPNARLVRNMRRCDRKLLPILKNWIVVDVVMTRFEIVYFDATDVDEVTLDQETEATRKAVVATHGGKGLRLKDVAVGRKVVGHLEFTDISSIHVERAMPLDTPRLCSVADNEVAQSEYWRQTSRESKLPRGMEWSMIKQDRLKLQDTIGSTLYLRFYADLEEARVNPERLAKESEDGGALFRNNAFCWASTIGRRCAAGQLHQPLPHFGSDTSDELRDYMVVHRYGADVGMGHRLWSAMRRTGGGGKAAAERRGSG